jgi:hypothetical protein
MYAGQEFVPPAEGEFHPVPADFQIALAPKPLCVDPATFALVDHRCARCDRIQRREGQHTTQTCQGFRRAAQRRLELKAVRCIVQKVLFAVAPPSILHISLDGVGSSLTTNQYSLLSIGRPRASWTGPYSCLVMETCGQKPAWPGHNGIRFTLQ